MYLEIDEGFPGHRKTLRLCSLMRNPEAGWYMIRLWIWACRSCPTGLLAGFTAYDIEMACQYRKLDGKCYAAMVDAGFIDTDAQGPIGIHGWMKRTGGAIKRMAEKASENRARREAARARYEADKGERGTGTVPVRSGNRTGTNPTKTRQDQSSQDQTSSTDPPSARAGACEPQAKIRPRTAHELILCLRVAVQREQPENGMWNPGGSFAHKEADDFLRGFGDDLEAALDTIERRIELFANDHEMRPWTVAKFAKAYNGIGAPKPTQRAAANGPRPVVWRES